MNHLSTEEIGKRFPYLYETHLHTSQGSACGRNTGAEMARACRQAGYTGIFVTDHNWGGNTAADRSLSWREWVERFAQGYRDARKTGERIGLDVFFGWEAGYRGTEFLIYGLTPEWLADHPELRDADVATQHEIVNAAGGMVIHAHPFRKEAYIPQIRLFPEAVDGVEGINASHTNPLTASGHNGESDRQAREYAIAHGFPMTAGSDVHSTCLLSGGMAFPRRMKDGEDFVRTVMSGEDYLLKDGEDWYSREGIRVAGQTIDLTD